MSETGKDHDHLAMMTVLYRRHPLRSRHHIGLRKRLYEISQRGPDLLWRVFLKEVRPLDSDFGLVRPRSTEFEYAALDDESRVTRDEQFRKRAPSHRSAVFFDDCYDVGGFAVNGDLARPN